MRFCCVCLVSLILLVGYCVGSEAEDGKTIADTYNGGRETLHRAAVYFKDLVNRLSNFNRHHSSVEPIHRVKRLQVEFPLNRCSNDSSCVNFMNVSSELVHCDLSTGLCVCSDCFVRINDTCQIVAPSCRKYSETSGQCLDLRKSQETAFLLSVFLSSVGAANFYIGHYLLGGLQLGLLIFIIVFICLLTCIPICCMMVYIDDDDDLAELIDSVRCTCYVLSSLVAVSILFIGVACWWVADIVVFTHNGRSDGNGCSLVADL